MHIDWQMITCECINTKKLHHMQSWFKSMYIPCAWGKGWVYRQTRDTLHPYIFFHVFVWGVSFWNPHFPLYDKWYILMTPFQPQRGYKIGSSCTLKKSIQRTANQAAGDVIPCRSRPAWCYTRFWFWASDAPRARPYGQVHSLGARSRLMSLTGGKVMDKVTHWGQGHGRGHALGWSSLQRSDTWARLFKD